VGSLGGLQVLSVVRFELGPCGFLSRRFFSAPRFELCPGGFLSSRVIMVWLAGLEIAGLEEKLDAFSFVLDAPGGARRVLDAEKRRGLDGKVRGVGRVRVVGSKGIVDKVLDRVAP
jgi:hypothetical protein